MCDTRAVPVDIPRQRALRRDAIQNRETILRTAAELFASGGQNVPLTEIANAAGVGVGTFYRSFPDRRALIVELQRRGLNLLLDSIDRIKADGLVGADFIEAYLSECLDLADQLVALPLRSGSPLADDASIQAKHRIYLALEEALAGGQADGTLHADVTVKDILVCATLLATPLPDGGGRFDAARDHLKIFVRGMRTATTP